VGSCVTCGAAACDQHAAACVEDGGRHCHMHLLALKDRAGAFACETHRTVCHVDNVAFSLTGTSACPVCDLRACARHTKKCGNCGRSVCATDWRGGGNRCATCDQLRPWDDPADAAIAAALEARAGERARGKDWKMARDATHSVIELSHGWRRRTVLALRHGDNRAEHVMTHSALGTRRRR
jgi:hypothetical protein